MKGELLFILGIALGIFLISSVSAGIYFSQPDSVYNLGDMIEMTVNVTLKMQDRSILFFFVIIILLMFTKELLLNLYNCHLLHFG